MRESDLEAVTEVAGQSMVSPWSVGLFAQEMQVRDGLRLVAVKDERLAGFIILRITKPDAELLCLAVRPKLRRKGVALAMLHEAFSQLKMKGIASCYLEVRPSSDSAIKLYSKQGFQEISRRPRYYRSPQEDALIMLKKF